MSRKLLNISLYRKFQASYITPVTDLKEEA